MNAAALAIAGALDPAEQCPPGIFSRCKAMTMDELAYWHAVIRVVGQPPWRPPALDRHQQSSFTELGAQMTFPGISPTLRVPGST